MWRLADQQLDEFVADGRCEFISAYAQPFAMLVVADLLGVPEEDHQRFREGFGLTRDRRRGRRRRARAARARTRWRGSTSGSRAYIEDRRREPRDDVLTDLALATYPDGTTPEVTSVVRTATFLFAAGQETTARLLAAALKHLAEHPELQDELRADQRPHPRLPRGGAAGREPGEDRLPPRPPHHRRIGGVDIAAGTPVMLLNGAANRDPAALRVPGRVPHRPRRTPRPTSRSVAAPTRAPVARSPGPRAGSASSASSTGCATSACPRSTTARPALAASTTSRRGSSAASRGSTSSSSRSRPADEPRRGRDPSHGDLGAVGPVDTGMVVPSRTARHPPWCSTW